MHLRSRTSQSVATVVVKTPSAPSTDGSAETSTSSSSLSCQSLIETNQFLRTTIPLFSSGTEANKSATRDEIRAFRDEIKNLRSYNKDLEKDNKELNKDISKLKKGLQSKEENFEQEKIALQSSHEAALQADRVKTATIYSDVLKDRDDLRKKNNSLTQENQRLKNELENTRRR